MKKNLWVLCSPNGVGNGPNLGMHTVDFAAYNITKKLNKKYNVILSSLWPTYKNNQSNLVDRDSFPRVHMHDLYMEKKIKPDDIVLFWGDFQWGYDFLNQSIKRLRKKVDTGTVYTEVEAEEIIKNHFLLRRLWKENTLKDITLMSYGSTLFQNNIKDLNRKEYINNLEALIRNSTFLKFRDPYSANYCAGVLNSYEQSFLGVDPALLSTQKELLSLPIGDGNFISSYEGNVGYYFGRSSRSIPKKKITLFIKKILKETGTKAVNIPWSHFGKKLFNTKNRIDNFEFYRKLFLLPTEKVQMDKFHSGDIIKGMKECSLILTDTYHLAVISILLGVPVVMFPDFQTSRIRDANMGYRVSWRDKRVLLFLTNNLSDLIVIPELLSDHEYCEAKINVIQKFIHDKSYLDKAYSGIHKQAVYDRKLLLSYLKHDQ